MAWRKNKKKKPSSFSSRNQDEEEEPLMDTPDLDQRMIRKAEAVLQWRTSRITVVVERCTNDHNYSAILRTAEALGVQHVWIIDAPPQPTLLETEQGEVTMENPRINAGRPVPNVTEEELKQRALHHLFAQGANDWLTVREFENTAECVKELRKTGHDIWVTDLSQEAVVMTPEGLSDDNNTSRSSNFELPSQLAIVFGTEAVGCSDEMLHAADKRVYLPLRGWADSLNLSVATSLCLHQLFVMDPSVIGAMPEDERRALRQAWYTQLCRQRLLTPKQKKARTRLQSNLRQCEKIQAKKDKGLKLQPGEVSKWNNREKFQTELKALEEEAHIDGNSKVSQAIQDLVDNPPRPLSDLRRADTHRVCFVGKNAKLGCRLWSFTLASVGR